MAPSKSMTFSVRGQKAKEIGLFAQGTGGIYKDKNKPVNRRKDFSKLATGRISILETPP